MSEPAFSKLTPESKDKLHKALAATLNLDELKTVCVVLGVEFEDLGGEGKEGKIRELVDFLDRVDQVCELIKRCEERRSHIAWNDLVEFEPIFDDDPGEGSPVEEPSPYVESPIELPEDFVN